MDLRGSYTGEETRCSKGRFYMHYRTKYISVAFSTEIVDLLAGTRNISTGETSIVDHQAHQAND